MKLGFLSLPFSVGITLIATTPYTRTFSIMFFSKRAYLFSILLLISAYIALNSQTVFKLPTRQTNHGEIVIPFSVLMGNSVIRSKKQTQFSITGSCHTAMMSFGSMCKDGIRFCGSPAGCQAGLNFFLLLQLVKNIECKWCWVGFFIE